MFNRKLKQELEVSKKTIRDKDDCIKGLIFKEGELKAEIKRLEEFNKKIDTKIEELCKPKINDFCLSMVGSGIIASSSSLTSLSNNFEGLEKEVINQSKEISDLKRNIQEYEKILLLSSRVEQLINQLNK